MRRLSLIAVVILLFSCVGCHSTAKDQTTLTPGYVNFQDSVMRFHLNQQASFQPLMVITYFDVEAYSEFTAIQIIQDGTVTVWDGISGTRSRALYSSQLSPDELDAVLRLSNTSEYGAWGPWLTSGDKGKYLITVSFGVTHSVRSCFDTSCPSDLCDVFDYVMMAVDNPASLIELACPSP